MAVLSASLLAAGVLRHYWDIYVHRTVRGISFIFAAIDAAGDLFSLVSVLFQPTLDVLGLVIYGTELALWIGVFACGGYFNLVPWVRKELETSKSNILANVFPRITGRSQGIEEIDLPSSTSVFRTPSDEIAAARVRTSASRRTNMDDSESRATTTEGAAD